MTVDASAALGERLREFRMAAALTQDQLDVRAGLRDQAVAALENGRSRRPYPHTLRALGDALGLSPEQRDALAAAVPGRTATSRPPATGAPVAVPPLGS